MKTYIKPELLVNELYFKKVLTEVKLEASDTDLNVDGEIKFN